MRYAAVCVLLGALALSGCGGGGDGGRSLYGSDSDGESSSGGSSEGGSSNDSDEDSTATPEGFFNGTTSNGFNFATVILESGEFWGVYSRSGVVYGAVHGGSDASGGRLQGEGYDFYLPDGTRTASNFTATYTAKTSIAGSVTPQGTSFTGTYDPSYDVPADINDIVGTWRGNAASEAGVQAATVTVRSDGSFAGSVSTCRYTGTVRPRPSGKAVFNLSIKFASTGCLFNGETLKGIAVVNTAGGQKSLYTAALLSDGSNGFLAAARQ